MAAASVWKRIAPNPQRLALHTRQTQDEKCFTIHTTHDQESPNKTTTLHIAAKTTQQETAALGYYLRVLANATLGWHRGGGSNLNPLTQNPMPSIHEPITVCRRSEKSYFMNVCTHSYSLVWYSWKQWEQLLDWMALRGINLFLAMTGQEEVQYKVFESFGLNDTEIRGWFNGPAFLTWSRGQNEYGAGIAGPLPRSFMRSQFALQKRILARARSLGIIGQLPGFQGNVPIALKAKLRDSSMTQQGDTAWMDSLDPNFGKVADVWMRELLHAFGPTDHWYQLDSYFNGGTAPWLWQRGASSGKKHTHVHPDPLWQKRGAQAYAGLSRSDPQAVWSFQGFAFEGWNATNASKISALRGLLSATPPGKLVIIDMDYFDSEWSRWGAYWGNPFIWTKLHEFGGTDGLGGNLTSARKLFVNQPSNLIGTGFTDEGIDQNPAYHDFLLDLHFKRVGPDPGQPEAVPTPSEYLIDRASRRYGIDNTSPLALNGALRAWKLISSSLLNMTRGVDDYTGVPHLPAPNNTHAVRWAWQTDRYTPTPMMCQTYMAWKALIETASIMQATSPLLPETLRYDLVNVGREVLAQISSPLSMNVSDSLYASPINPEALRVYGDSYVELLSDLDVLVASDQAFLLGSWLEMARTVGRAHLDLEQEYQEDDDCTADRLSASGVIPEEIVGCAAFYEWNARVQLTTWKPVSKGGVVRPHAAPVDYASKHWSGLISGYYQKRAEAFLEAATDLAALGKTFTSNLAGRIWGKVAFEFQTDRKTQLPLMPVGDPVATSKQMREKYGKRYLSACISDPLVDAT